MKKKIAKHTPSIEMSMMNYLDMKIQGMNEYVKSLKRLGIYVTLDVNYPGQVYVTHFTVRETAHGGQKG